MTKPLDKMTKAELRQVIRAQNDELQVLRARVSIVRVPLTHSRNLKYEDVKRFFAANPDQKSAVGPVIQAWAAANPA